MKGKCGAQTSSGLWILGSGFGCRVRGLGSWAVEFGVFWRDP